MKISKILLPLIAGLCVFSAFGEATTVAQAQKDKELFDFSITATPTITPSVEAPKIVPDEVKVPEKTETAPADATKTETETKTEETPTTVTVPPILVAPVTPAALVADAETLIKDKLVQKYQVRLDDVISRMTSRLAAVSAEEQRVALTDLRDRMAEKKTLVIAKKDLEPLKRDIIIAILDHVIYRVEGLLKQSAQTSTEGKWAA